MSMMIDAYGLKTGNKRLTFGYGSEEYANLFPRSEHIGYLRKSTVPGRYLFTVDEVIRERSGGSVRSYNDRIPGERELMMKALEADYGIKIEG